jgi:hypothetical protein
VSEWRDSHETIAPSKQLAELAARPFSTRLAVLPPSKSKCQENSMSAETVVFRGVFEDNDAGKRLEMIVDYNRSMIRRYAQTPTFLGTIGRGRAPRSAA